MTELLLPPRCPGGTGLSVSSASSTCRSGSPSSIRPMKVLATPPHSRFSGTSVCPPHSGSEQLSRVQPLAFIPYNSMGQQTVLSPPSDKETEVQRGEAKAPCSPSFHLLFPLPGILFPVTVPSCVHALQVSPQLSPESPSLSTCPAVFLPGAHPSQGAQASSCVCFLSLFSNQSSQGGTREQGSQSDSFLHPPAHTAAQHRHGTHQGQSQHV